MIEEAYVVVLPLERLDLPLDEVVEGVQRRLDLLWDLEVHLCLHPAGEGENVALLPARAQRLAHELYSFRRWDAQGRKRPGDAQRLRGRTLRAAGPRDLLHVRILETGGEREGARLDSVGGGHARGRRLQRDLSPSQPREHRLHGDDDPFR